MKPQIPFSLLVLLVFVYPANIFSQEFSAIVTDREGTTYELDQVESAYPYYSDDRRQTRFRNLRRGGSSFELDFENIRSVEFGEEVDNRLLANVELISGRDVNLTFPTGMGGLTLYGFDTLVASDVRLPSFQALREIRFLHDNTARRCPTTGRTFYHAEYNYSPYTGEQLEVIE